MKKGPASSLCDCWFNQKLKAAAKLQVSLRVLDLFGSKPPVSAAAVVWMKSDLLVRTCSTLTIREFTGGHQSGPGLVMGSNLHQVYKKTEMLHPSMSDSKVQECFSVSGQQGVLIIFIFYF